MGFDKDSKSISSIIVDFIIKTRCNILHIMGISSFFKT